MSDHVVKSLDPNIIHVCSLEVHTCLNYDNNLLLRYQREKNWFEIMLLDLYSSAIWKSPY